MLSSWFSRSKRTVSLSADRVSWKWQGKQWKNMEKIKEKRNKLGGKIFFSRIDWSLFFLFHEKMAARRAGMKCMCPKLVRRKSGDGRTGGLAWRQEGGKAAYLKETNTVLPLLTLRGKKEKKKKKRVQSSIRGALGIALYFFSLVYSIGGWASMSRLFRAALVRWSFLHHPCLPIRWSCKM